MKRGIVSGYEVEFPDVETGASLENNYGGNRPSKGVRKNDVGNVGGKDGDNNQVQFKERVSGKTIRFGKGRR